MKLVINCLGKSEQEQHSEIQRQIRQAVNAAISHYAEQSTAAAARINELDELVADSVTKAVADANPVVTPRFHRE